LQHHLAIAKGEEDTPLYEDMPEGFEDPSPPSPDLSLVQTQSPRTQQQKSPLQSEIIQISPVSKPTTAAPVSKRGRKRGKKNMVIIKQEDPELLPADHSYFCEPQKLLESHQETLDRLTALEEEFSKFKEKCRIHVANLEEEVSKQKAIAQSALAKLEEFRSESDCTCY
jgi:hypothetical protein